MISSLAMGGAERAAAGLGQDLRRRGHQVSILTLGGEAENQYPVADGVRVIALGQQAASGGLFAAVAANLRRGVAVRAQAKRLQPDVILAMMDRTAVLVALSCVSLPALKIGCERVAPHLAPLPRSWRALRALSYGLLDVVVAQTRPAADWLQQHTMARRVRVIANSVTWPLPRVSPVVEPASLLAPRQRLVLGVGRLASQKRFDRLIDAFALVATERPAWKLAIAGEGPLRDDLEARAEAKGLASRVHLIGRVGNLADWYERADVFALTSDFEGFPNVLIEAMAHGVASVSVDCPFGPGDIVRSGTDGLLVSHGDMPAFAAGLATLMDDDRLRTRLAAAAMEVRDRFSAERALGLWEELFRMADRDRPAAAETPSRATNSTQDCTS